MPIITAKFRWTAEDLITGRKYAIRHKRRGRLILLLAVAFVMFMFGLLNGSQPKHDSGAIHLSSSLTVFGVLIGVILFALPLGKYIAARINRRQFAKRPDADEDILWECSDTGIVTSSSNTQSEIKWAAFYKVLATPAGFLFMPNAQIFHFIPNRAFGSPADIESLKTLARQHARDFKVMK
jgi:hypothetical protein